MDSSAASPGSISFVVATENGTRQADVVIDVIAKQRRDTDEVILLTRSDQTPYLPGPPRPWLRIVGIPNANIFTLRAQIPAVARKEWVLLLEEHAFITRTTLIAIRAVIEGCPNVDLIPFLGKNLKSTSPWGWTSFINAFASVWAPLDHAPPFCVVTSTAVRRAALGLDTPLIDGQWEFQLIPGIFAGGKIKYSNEIYIDHFKPLNALSCFLVNFHNARACGALMCRLGAAGRDVRRNAWFALARWPTKHMRAIGARRHELPPGIPWRLRVVGFAFFLGMMAGTLFGPGQSPHKLD